MSCAVCWAPPCAWRCMAPSSTWPSPLPGRLRASGLPRSAFSLRIAFISLAAYPTGLCMKPVLRFCLAEHPVVSLLFESVITTLMMDTRDGYLQLSCMRAAVNLKLSCRWSTSHTSLQGGSSPAGSTLERPLTPAKLRPRRCFSPFIRIDSCIRLPFQAELERSLAGLFKMSTQDRTLKAQRDFHVGSRASHVRGIHV